MNTDYFGVIFAIAGLAVGYALGGTTTAILASLVGFFFGKIVFSLTKTFDVE